MKDTVRSFVLYWPHPILVVKRQQQKKSISTFSTPPFSSFPRWKSPMSQPVTEAELAHFKEVMVMLKSRWAGLTEEARINMTTVNEHPAQREESMNEFQATWASADSNSDGRLTQEEFCVFNSTHLCNIKSRLGWAPELTKSDSEQIWESINALEPNASGIRLADYGRYHAVMKVYIN